MRLEPRLFGDDCAVDVKDLVAGLPHCAYRSYQQVLARCSFVLRIGIWKMLADVAEAGGAEHRIDHRVRQDVSIGVAVQPQQVVDAHPTQDQGATGAEWMDVVAGANPHVVAASCSLMSASTTSRSSGVVSLMLA